MWAYLEREFYDGGVEIRGADHPFGSVYSLSYSFLKGKI